MTTNLKTEGISDLDFDASRVQLIEADPDVQDYGHLNEEILQRRFKSHALIDNTILVNATHILKSPLTHSVLSSNPELLEQGIVVPTMTSLHSGFDDMVENKLTDPERYGPWWTSNNRFQLKEDSLAHRAELLKRHATRSVLHDIGEMRSVFSGSLVDDLSTPRSKLYRDISRHMNPKKLRERIQKTDHSSRKFVANNAETLPKRVSTRLKKQADINYHITGATRRKATATFHPQDYHHTQQSYNKFIKISGQSNDEIEVISNRNDGVSNAKEQKILKPQYSRPHDAIALCEYFNVSNRIEHDIANLDMETILELRERRETRNLIRKLSEIVMRFPQKGYNDIGTLHDLRMAEQDYRETLRSLIEEERKKEIRRLSTSKSFLTPDRILSKGGIANVTTATAISMLSNHLLNAGIESSVASGAGAYVLQNWLSTRGIPKIIESDMIDFEEIYDDLYGLES